MNNETYQNAYNLGSRSVTNCSFHGIATFFVVSKRIANANDPYSPGSAP